MVAKSLPPKGSLTNILSSQCLALHIISGGNVLRRCKKLVLEFVKRRAYLVVSWEYYDMRMVVPY